MWPQNPEYSRKRGEYAMDQDKRPEDTNDWLSASNDYFQDTLESITENLPGQNEAPVSEEPEENPSDTPDVAMERFLKERGIDPEAQDEPAPKKKKEKKIRIRKKKHREPATDANEETYEFAKEHPRLRKLFLSFITVFLTVTLLSIALLKIADVRQLSVVSDTVSEVVTPVQNTFSSVTESVAGFIRRIKFWYNLENEYNALREENEQLVYQAMRADELQTQLAQFEDMYDEIRANANLNPIVCTVTARDEGNYFSTFTINRGAADGISEYMAVTSSGALIGYTEQVFDHSATVRTIIDSEASIAALIKSSRDQGTVRGTLGIDGTAMCRMYYLPDDHLPRPGDEVVTSGVSMPFPKGIPIGTVRESTRGMEANKQYIVVEPEADFQHIEYVIVLRYQPEAGAIQDRSDSSTAVGLVPLETARPYPTIRIGSMNYFGTDTPAPDTTETPAPTETLTPAPTEVLTATPTPVPEDYVPPTVFEYQVVMTPDPNETPTPTPSPSPTPYITLGPEDLTLEDD